MANNSKHVITPQVPTNWPKQSSPNPRALPFNLLSPAERRFLQKISSRSIFSQGELIDLLHECFGNLLQNISDESIGRNLFSGECYADRVYFNSAAEPQIVGDNDSSKQEIILDQLPKIEIDLDMPEIMKSRKPSFLTTKENDSVENELPFDKLLTNLDKIGNILQLINTFPNLKPEQKEALKSALENHTSSCSECKLTPSECLMNRQKTREVILQEEDEIKRFWIQQEDLRSCLVLVLLEKLKQ